METTFIYYPPMYGDCEQPEGRCLENGGQRSRSNTRTEHPNPAGGTTRQPRSGFVTSCTNRSFLAL